MKCDARVRDPEQNRGVDMRSEMTAYPILRISFKIAQDALRGASYFDAYFYVRRSKRGSCERCEAERKDRCE